MQDNVLRIWETADGELEAALVSTDDGIKARYRPRGMAVTDGEPKIEADEVYLVLDEDADYHIAADGAWLMKVTGFTTGDDGDDRVEYVEHYGTGDEKQTTDLEFVVEVAIDRGDIIPVEKLEEPGN